MPPPLETVRAYYRLFEQASREALDRLVDDDFALDDNPIDWHLRGKEDLWRTVNRDRPAGAGEENSGSFVVEEYFGDEAAGAARWVWKATGATAAIFGLPPSGSLAEVHGVALVTFHDGKLKSLTEYWDAAGLLRQLGADVPQGRMPQPAN